MRTKPKVQVRTMAVIKDFDDQQKIKTTIQKMYKHMAAFNTCPLTLDEALTIFCQTEVIYDTIREASKLVAIPEGGSLRVELPEYLYVYFNFGTASLIPSHRTVTQTVIEPDNLWNKHRRNLIFQLEPWVERAKEINYHFSLMRELFVYLNRHCKSLKEIRYLWSPIYNILMATEEPDLQARAKAIQSFTNMRESLVLPAEVRSACRTTAGVIAKYGLLSGVQPPEQPFKANISFRDIGTPHVKELGYVNYYD